MTLPNHTTPFACLLALLMAVSPASHARQPAPLRKAEAQTPMNQAVQPQVDKRAADETAKKRSALMAEAQTALAETERAVRALNEKRSKDALNALALATGKLELILARNPKLALAPVRTDVVTHDLLANIDTVKAAVKEVRDQLGDGEVQKL